MQISYIINQKSKTSIPITWANYLNDNNINVKILAIKEISSLKNLMGSNILHGHHIKAMYITLLFNKILKKKAIYTVHGSYLYLSEQNKKLFRYICKESDKIVFVNKYLYEVLPDDLKNIIKDKYHIILNGIDLNLKYKKIDVYSKYNILKKDKIIFHPARFVKEKNHLNIIKSFKKVKDSMDNVKLILAGDGILRKEIEQLIKELKLEKDVVLLGLISRDEVYNFLEKVDLFIMPSISEGLNIAFLEAMVFKRKILVSNISQFTYPFEHYNLNPKYYNVYFTNPNDINEIFQQIKFLITQKRNENFNMDCFSIESMMNEYIKIYKELI